MTDTVTTQSVLEAQARDGHGTAPLSTQVADQFPILKRRIEGQPLTYLDSAATSQTPQVVVDALVRYYTHYRASVDRGVYPLLLEATDAYESSRQAIADWLHSTVEETIFTSGATMSLNLVAQTWGRTNVGAGDVIVVTEMEHHSNVVPWQQLALEKGATLRYIPVDDDGKLDLDVYAQLLELEPKVVAFTHVSNVVGTINPVADLVRAAHAAGAITVVDGTQAIPQMPVDLREIDADFYAWSGHKVYGPTGIGVLHGRRALLEEMPPFIAGGHMIKRVSDDSSTWTDLPGKYEAGTSAIAEGIGLGAAVGWVQEIGLERIRAHEQALTAELLDRLAEFPGIHIHGPRDASDRGGLVSFTLDGAHPHDIGEILGREGVCIRTGHHCAQPLMRRLGIAASARASFAVHNTSEDIDRFIAGLHSVERVLEL